MRFKLDENFDQRLAPLLTEAGHDVDNVLQEGLSGQRDETIYKACRDAQRALITLDLDFSNPFRFPPSSTEGIIVVRPVRPVLPLVRAALMQALSVLKSTSLRGTLWIAEPGRVRVYDPCEGPANS